MALIQFTVQYDFLAVTSDSSDINADADIVALIGEVSFIPQFTSSNPLVARDYSPRPTGFRILPVKGFIDTDGRLKNARAGTLGVRLIANDPVLDLEDPLVYRVDFELTTPFGEPVRVDSVFFEAPDSDIDVELAEVLETALSSVGPAPRLVSGFFNADGDIEFQNADGTLVSPISIPQGYLVFVDNGDSTWSVG